ncbi:transglutaminase family protein [Rhizorhabdus dicambivorans]|uniref:Transglutaminase family protein n=1 Tax=Rhizorhabdus dicambivorans TaxID=1850238 RepID=A0A2A4FZA0_9SPHN|nr:transglutaminase family protein [Rhizorhabdus dicambivorans]ATE65936.1 transglutaminase family protein [Rhizorhabdus dicambivorans]PCE43052.1 transglutaminase family protein [Rhizorhabdus dicambivorans]
MHYQVRHKTRFRYAYPVSFARCNLRLRPVEWAGQTLERYELELSPVARITGTRPIGYLGHVSRMVMEKPTRELVIESRFRMRVDRPTPTPRPGDPSIAAIAGAARGTIDMGVESPANYLYPSPSIPLSSAITAWCAEHLDPARGIVDAGLALATRIHDRFKYDGSATTVDTSPIEAFEKRHGVCQDFAQIMIAGLRGAGLPAAYVSGYLRTVPPPGKERLVGADATHAWVVIWCGKERGWLGFDPTNACMVGSDHIVTAMGRDYADVAPIDGVFTGQEGQKIDVSVDVEPLG